MRTKKRADPELGLKELKGSGCRNVEVKPGTQKMLSDDNCCSGRSLRQRFPCFPRRLTGQKNDVLLAIFALGALGYARLRLFGIGIEL